MTTRRATFARWRRERPFWGAVLIAIGGIEEFFSGQLDIGKIHIQLGLEGLQALVVPAILVLLAILIALMPVHRIFYGVIALLLSLYSLIGVNLGGFIIGMLLSAVGGILVVAWVPKTQAEARRADASPEPARQEPAHSRVLHGEGHAEPVIPPSLRTPSASGDETPGPDTSRRRRVMRGGAAVAVAALTVALAAAAPQQARAAEPAAVQSGCVLLIFCSPDPSPSPTPTPSSTTPAPSPTPSSGSGGSLIEPDPSGGTSVQIPGQSGGSVPAPGQTPTTTAPAPSDPTTQTPLVAIGADNDHGIFTTPSANTWGDTLKIAGPSQVGIVTVPLANGARATAIRIECDELTIGNFHLDSSNRQELVNLDTHGMTLKGHAVIWIDRIGTKYGDGEGLDKSLQANPLTLEALMTLLGQGHMVLGLIGAQADTLSYSDFHETAALQSSGVPSGD
ncbi:hypothetical protein GCM10022288_06660 [Gryllotalpicola kribbensis]|uniref:Uncharacterized protein n=1 Tax=Gryllotalpicola kribbensis TaxID=993084 RepID=A0ABP8AJY3_9MICO